MLESYFKREAIRRLNDSHLQFDDNDEMRAKAVEFVKNSLDLIGICEHEYSIEIRNYYDTNANKLRQYIVVVAR